MGEPIQFNVNENLTRFFSLLLEIDRENNPQFYKFNEQLYEETNSNDSLL